MKLTLVVPVWNDPDGLRRLLAQAQSMDVFSQIIVSDDNSSPALDASLYPAPVQILHSPVQRGAGHARNLALPHITGDHVIFFDSDDLFLDDFTALVADLQGMEFDFCIYRHIDNRFDGGLGPDDAAWGRAGATPSHPTPLSRAGATQLCRISAYPWNKIYRTQFLRDAGIRCTEIPVHNDLELHWMGFLKADRILTSTRLCCEHFVQDQGGRLTNRSGRERLEVFQALQNVSAALETSPALPDYLEPFAEFTMRLLDWIAASD